MATFKVGETVVDLKSGQQFKVEGGDIELDQTKYGKMGPANQAGGLNISPQEAQSAAAGNLGGAADPAVAKLPPPSQDLIPPEIAKQGRAASVADANRTSGQLAKNVLMPLGQAGASMALGGVGLPAMAGHALLRAGGNAAIQAGGNAALEYGMQKAGANPEDLGQVGLAAAMPGVAQLATRGLGGASRALANITGKGQMAGEQAIAHRAGVPQEAINRARHNPAEPAYNAVRNNQQWIDVEPAYQAVRAAYETEQALGSQANRQSLRYLEGLMNDLQPAVNGNTTVTSAENLAARAQRLSAAATEAFKRKNSTLGTTLSNAANAFKGSVPGLREADVVYTRQNAINDIFGAVRKGKKVEAIDALLTDPKKGARVRNAMADDELRDIRLIASRMVGSSGSEAGMLKTMADTAVKSFLANPNGLTVFRHAFGPRFETLTPERMAGLMTFIRAYNAQTAGNED